MSNFKMPTAYQPSNVEWVRPIESLTSDGVRELQRLQTENAKLREYVTWLEEAVIESGYVPSQTKTWLDAKRFELGIEVSA